MLESNVGGKGAVPPAERRWKTRFSRWRESSVEADSTTQEEGYFWHVTDCAMLLSNAAVGSEAAARGPRGTRGGGGAWLIHRLLPR